MTRAARRCRVARRFVAPSPAGKEETLKLTRADLQADIVALHRRVTRGEGTTPPDLRQAAAAGEHVEGPLGAYLDKVRDAPLDVTDEEVAALRASGVADDVLFELTVATALGAARVRLDAGLEAVARAYGEG